jgi:hypothetical protein
LSSLDGRVLSLLSNYSLVLNSIFELFNSKPGVQMKSPYLLSRSEELQWGGRVKSFAKKWLSRVSALATCRSQLSPVGAHWLSLSLAVSLAQASGRY